MSVFCHCKAIFEFTAGQEGFVRTGSACEFFMMQLIVDEELISVCLFVSMNCYCKNHFIIHDIIEVKNNCELNY